jgi:TetR/AcrR family transcriptional regulator
MPKATHKKPRAPRTAAPAPKQQRNAEATRKMILSAALIEFANAGVEGARTDRIAKAAGVNKALLYYYFKDKTALYGAALDNVFETLFQTVTAALDRPISPCERLMAYVEAHFDFIAATPVYPRLVMREMMGSGHAPSEHLIRIFQRMAVPVYTKLMTTLKEGIEAGELRPVSPQQTVPTLIGIIVFYFASSTTQKLIGGYDPLSPESIANRRRSVIDFIRHALITEEHLEKSSTAKKARS